MKIKFLGACQQVTGSSYLVEGGGLRILIDCGYYQEREYLYRNWEKFPVSPESIDFLLLTHIHLDHSGLIPKFVREGFSNSILTTSPSQDLLPIILKDSARIQEEDAAFKKKRHRKEGRKGPHPEIPLYTLQDAERALPLVKKVEYNQSIKLNSHVSVRFYEAGHILGSAMIKLTITEKNQSKSILFSGDMGQWNKPIIRNPTRFKKADYVVMESTYGSRNHEDSQNISQLLKDTINTTVEAKGNVVIPTFAVERAQELLFYLSELARKDQIPYLMAFLDSPMAVDVTQVFPKHKNYFDQETKDILNRGMNIFRFPGLKLVHSVGESKAINSIKSSCIIMAGSGMCTGGRIKHHLLHNISRPESTVLFVGYQAAGTLGRKIVEKNPEVRIHGHHHEVKARIQQIHGFSAHADKDALLNWAKSFQTSPQQIFLTHGEKEEATSLAESIRSQKGWHVQIPEYLQEYEL
ncbi:MBL fold metallo-hydrolase [bacterium]|nr:MBL fold metallo-hydrolase [bacterium]